MKNPDWGSKHICPDCTIKYYDLGKEIVTCPKCGAAPPVAKVSKAQLARKINRPKFQRFP